MGPMQYRELEDRAIPAGIEDAVKKLEARALIHQEIESMRSEGKALTLSDEEFRLIESFRRFKLRMRKNGEVFTWQTRLPEGIEVVQDTAEVLLPAEAER